MKFCCNCASPVAQRVPPGDNLPRWVCDQCGEIHYQNPRIVVGSIPEFEGKLLLCRRAIEPRYGYWTLPAGFMENGETIAQGAARETLEEAGTAPGCSSWTSSRARRRSRLRSTTRPASRGRTSRSGPWASR
jgi:NADH pyrophosphatase NudC (nudix superfamily)